MEVIYDNTVKVKISFVWIWFYIFYWLNWIVFDIGLQIVAVCFASYYLYVWKSIF